MLGPAACVAMCPAVVLAAVDLLLDPAVQTVSVDDVIEINLVAHSSDGTPQSITSIDAILDWDPAILELLGVDDSSAGHTLLISGFLSDPDGINDGIDDPPDGVPDNDGDAIYTALYPPADPASSAPDLIVTTLQFRALAPSAGTVVSFLESLGSFGQTRVFGVGAQNDITGDISATASIEIVEDLCPADLNGDMVVDAFDLAQLLGAWGANPGHPADFNGDDVVNATDLAQLLGAWGQCPI